MAARKPSPKDAPVDFEDLITADIASEGTPDIATVSENSDPVSTAETPAQRRIRELKAELEKPIPTPSEPDEVEETEEDREIKELESKLAVRNAKILDEAKESYRPVSGKTIVIHVETDGFTEFGRVWLRGQNILITETDYKRTQDRNGVSWLDSYVEDPQLQYRMWGAVYIGPGEFVPRPGEEPFDDAVAKEDARRAGRVPFIAPGID